MAAGSRKQKVANIAAWLHIQVSKQVRTSVIEFNLMRIYLPSIFIVLTILLLSACGLAVPSDTQSEVLILSATQFVPKASDDHLTPVSLKTPGEPTPTGTSRAPSTANFPPTATPTVTATATPEHPLMIEVMRLSAYPGSEIVFEETLEDGANYDRYIVSYQSEGHKIYALLTVPDGPPPVTGWPVIIFNHGYIPPEQYRTTERYVNYVDVLARNGYIILRSDYRGHGSSEGVPKSSYQSPGYTVDILNAIASIKRYEHADPNRIGMWGHSMGGNITLRAMVISKEIKAG